MSFSEKRFYKIADKPIRVPVLMLCAGITLIMNYAKVKFD